MTALLQCDPILYYSHDIAQPLYLLCTLVLNLRVDSWKCSSFGASIVCLSPHQISWVSIILILLHCRKDSQVYFSINLLSTAEYSYSSHYLTTAILSLVGSSFTTLIWISELSSGPTRGPAYKSFRAISRPHIGRLHLIFDNPTWWFPWSPKLCQISILSAIIMSMDSLFS